MSSVLKGTAPQGGASGKIVSKAVRGKTIRGEVVRGERLNEAAPAEAALGASAFEAEAAGDAAFSEESAAEEQEAHGHVGQSGFFGRFVEASGVPTPRRREPAAAEIDEVQISNRGLQHAIDALHAANVELRAKVDALRGTALELQHMLDSVELGVMLLDEGLVLLKFNAMAAQFLDLDAQDLGNPIAASCWRLGSLLETWCHDVSRSGRRAEHSCRSAIGEPLTLRIRSTRIDGVARLILVFAEASAE